MASTEMMHSRMDEQREADELELNQGSEIRKAQN